MSYNHLEKWFLWPNTKIPKNARKLKDMAFYLAEGLGTCHETDIDILKEYEDMPRVAQNIVKIYYDRIRNGESIYV